MTPHDPADHGGTWAEVAAACEFLDATTRPGYTVWHAVTDAVSSWTAAVVEEAPPERRPVWDDPDGLRTSVERLLAVTSPGGPAGEPALHELLTIALRAWLDDIASEVNDGHPFTSGRR